MNDDMAGNSYRKNTDRKENNNQTLYVRRTKKEWWKKYRDSLRNWDGFTRQVWPAFIPWVGEMSIEEIDKIIAALDG